MPYKTVIGAGALKDLLASKTPPVVLDCEFELGAPDKGLSIYNQGHIAGARYAHLDHDLASASDGTNGRHPLPKPDVLAAWLRGQGLNQCQQVVAYDSNGGAWAARAWWLLKWLGHSDVAVLDGGKQAWVAAGYSLEPSPPKPILAGNFEAGKPLVPTPASANEVLANITSQEAQVLDARDPARFIGTPNPMDPVAGHIPMARNRFFKSNLNEDGTFKDAKTLKQDFSALLEGQPAIMQCGSGVTACHNALAMEIAGLPAPRLYAGSWSEWISDPSRPVATGSA